MIAYTVADAILDDPFIGLALLGALMIAIWIVRQVFWKPMRAAKARRDVDAIKRELQQLGHSVAENHRSITRHPITTTRGHSHV